MPTGTHANRSGGCGHTPRLQVAPDSAAAADGAAAAERTTTPLEWVAEEDDLPAVAALARHWQPARVPARRKGHAGRAPSSRTSGYAHSLPRQERGDYASPTGRRTRHAPQQRLRPARGLVQPGESTGVARSRPVSPRQEVAGTIEPCPLTTSSPTSA